MLSKIKKLILDHGVKRYFFNTVWLMLDRVLGLIINLFIGVWVVRYLGPEEFGLLSYALSLVGLFMAFGALGLDAVVVRNIVNNPDERDSILGTAFFLKAIGNSTLLFLVFIALQLSGPTPDEKILVYIIAVAYFFKSFDVIDFYFQAEVKGKQSSIAGVISLLFSGSAKVCFILLGLPVLWFAMVVILEFLTRALVLIVFYCKRRSSFAEKESKQLSILTWSFCPQMAKSLLKDSWPLFLSGLVVMVYMRIDQVMIKEMMGKESVGLYAAAVKLSEAWYFVPIMITTSVFPAIIQSKNETVELYHKRLQQLYDGMVCGAISIALIITLLSEWILALLFGPEYSEASSALTMHVWAGVFVVLAVTSGKWLLLENLQKYSLYRTLTGAFLNVGLNYVLIPVYGIRGAALATLVSQAVAGYLFNGINAATREAFLFQTNAIFYPLRVLGIKFTKL